MKFKIATYSMKLLKEFQKDRKKHSTDSERILWEKLKTKKLDHSVFYNNPIKNPYL